MEKDQKDTPSIIEPQPPKRSDKKLTALIFVLFGLVLIYIFYPKNITSCKVLEDIPSCSKYVCWGISAKNFGEPVCWGKLKLIGPTLPRVSIESFVFGKEANDLCGLEPPAICPGDTSLKCRVIDKKWGCYPLSPKN